MSESIVIKHPKDLRPHRLLKRQPEWDDKDPRFLALVESVRQQGCIERVKITEAGEIADGRHRWRVSKRLQIDVPCEIVKEEDVPSIIFDSLLHRRHYTPGQRAYMLADAMEPAFLAAQNRKLAALKQGSAAPVRNSVPNGAKTLEEWAEEVGVSVRYLRQVHELCELFKDEAKRTIHDDDTGEDICDTTFRDFYEAKILAEEKPMGMGGALAGIKFTLAKEQAEARGRQHTGGKPKQVEKQLELFTATFKDELKRWSYFERFDDETREQHFTAVRAQVAKLPPEKCEALAAYHQKLAREFTKAAKAGKDE